MSSGSESAGPEKNTESSPGSQQSQPVPKKGMQPALILLAAVYFLGTILQHVLGKIGLVHEGNIKVSSVVLGLVAFSLVLAAGWQKQLLRFFTSNRFSVPVILTLTFLSILGTLILQNEPLPMLQQTYGSAFSIIHAFFLEDIFHSLGFSALIGMGAGGLALVVSRKRRWTARYTSSVGAHVGLLLILAGAAIGNVWGVKGRLSMHTGQASKHFVVTAPGNEMYKYPLGFALRLDEFRLEQYEPEYRLMVFEVNGKKENLLVSVDPSTKKPEGLLNELGVKILDYWPDHVKETVVEPIEAEPGPNQPAALALGRAKEDQEPEWVFDNGAKKGGRLSLTGGQLVFFWDQDRANRFLEALAASSSGPAHVIIAADKEIKVELGKSYPIPGSDLRFEVVQALFDFVMDGKTRKPANRSDKPNNPAIELIFKDTQGKQLGRHWLFEKHPDFHGKQDGPASNLRYKFMGTAQESLAKWIVVGETRELWLLAGSAVVEKREIKEGTALKLGQHKLIVSSLQRSVRRSYKHSSRSSRANKPVIQFQIEGESKPLIMGAKKPYRLSDGNVLVLASKSGESVRDYLSLVSIFENGKKILTKTIEVNSPLEYKGFSFYQTDYRPDDPTFSGFQVVRDPGLLIVYLGFIVNFAGVFCAVFLPPIRKRKSAGKVAEGEVS
jgi:ResB-like family protein